MWMWLSHYHPLCTVCFLIGGRPSSRGWTNDAVGVVGCIANITLTSVDSKGLHLTAELATASHHVTRCRWQVPRRRRIGATQVTDDKHWSALSSTCSELYLLSVMRLAALDDNSEDFKDYSIWKLEQSMCNKSLKAITSVKRLRLRLTDPTDSVPLDLQHLFYGISGPECIWPSKNRSLYLVYHHL